MIPVVLSGGSGTRLWPVSRQSFPKQFCDLLDESLYSKTVNRLKPLGTPWTITVSQLGVLTERALKDASVPLSNVVYEPFGKNTAPAIALLCKIFEDQGHTNEVVGIFPADQLIENEDSFRKAVIAGVEWAEKGEVVTLGVKPTFPATGYGYIETAGSAGSSASGISALKASGFREKPNESTAREFISRGTFYWNAGMFIFRVSRMIELLKTHAADVWTEVSQLSPDRANLKDIYSRVKGISIDYAVMEKLTSHVCIPCDFDWSDVGSWDAVAEVLSRKPTSQSSIVNVEAESNFVVPASGKTYAFVGVDDLIVVDTADAILISKKGMTERVKDVVDKLKSLEATTATQHPFEVRPWGKFEILRDTDQFKSKRISVDAGAQISYQSHAKRAEHWIIVEGTGEVILDDEVIPVQAGKHVHIPTGAKHRIRNTGTVPLDFVEVQLGSYFGEDDIVRYQDDYKRV